MPKCSGSGFLIEGSHCPLDSEPLEYNGNYWCSNPKCSYIMPADRMKSQDKHAFNVAYTLLMQAHDREPKPEVLYWNKLREEPY